MALIAHREDRGLGGKMSCSHVQNQGFRGIWGIKFPTISDGLGALVSLISLYVEGSLTCYAKHLSES